MERDSLLLRYLEERDFVDMFMSGHIRLNSLGFFWGEHDEPTKDGQIDSLEGLVCPIDAKSIEDCSRADMYKHCNLLCCNRLNYVIDDDNIGWYLNNEMSAFGDYVVIIKDPDEFQRRLVSAANDQQYSCYCHNVDYSNRLDAARDVFDKSPDYSYQNEWRAALFRGPTECTPCELYIGPIGDIAEWAYTRELPRHLNRIFHDRDFRRRQASSYGNVTRSELTQLFKQIG